jgi:hypothetical protein
LFWKTAIIFGERCAESNLFQKQLLPGLLAASPDQAGHESPYFWASSNEKIFLSLYFLELNALFIKKGRIFIFREVPIQAFAVQFVLIRFMATRGLFISSHILASNPGRLLLQVLRREVQPTRA